MTAAIVAVIDTTAVHGEPGLNSDALALLTGYPVAAVEGWMRLGGMPPKAVQAGRRRGSEASAALGIEMGMLDAIVYYAIREGASVQLDDEFIVRDGVAVAS